VPSLGPAGSDATVKVVGLDELRRDLRAMDRRLGGKEGVTALNRELQLAGNEVVKYAKSTTIHMAGMVGTERRRRDSSTGRLYGKPRTGYRPRRTKKSVRARVSKGKAIVEARAKSNRGSYKFGYPHAYEHNTWKGRSISSPHREFMYPALYATRDEVLETLAEGMERIMKQYWHSTSGTTGGIRIG